MKRMLIKKEIELYHIVGSEKIKKIHSGLRGNCSGLRGDCSGIRGDCSGLSGDLDECKITESERKNGINIIDLIKN